MNTFALLAITDGLLALGLSSRLFLLSLQLRVHHSCNFSTVAFLLFFIQLESCALLAYPLVSVAAVILEQECAIISSCIDSLDIFLFSQWLYSMSRSAAFRLALSTSCQSSIDIRVNLHRPSLFSRVVSVLYFLKFQFLCAPKFPSIVINQ